MSRIHVSFDESPERSHDIVFAALDQLPAQMSAAGLRHAPCVIVTDLHVGELYGDAVEAALGNAGWDSFRVTLPPGEPSKSLEQLSRVLDQALEAGIERTSPLIALGGGVVGDVAGFAAAILLRGIPFVQVPTSLVAQVDSSIGGKTGINHATGKNLIGAFLQPSLVLTDTSTLSTLPDDEWTAGLSEVVKTALIRDVDLFGWLRDRWKAVLAREAQTAAEMVRRCAKIKVDVVRADERERGERAILNFGHTFGHALEKVGGYSGLTHGVAVALGMRAALYLSARRYPQQDFSDAEELVERLPIPHPPESAHLDSLIAAMQMDKKRMAGKLRFILLARPGAAVIVDDVTEPEIRAAWEHALGPFKSGHRSTD